MNGIVPEEFYYALVFGFNPLQLHLEAVGGRIRSENKRERR